MQPCTAMPPGFFKWEPIPFNILIVPSLFTIIAPGFTEEVSTPSEPDCICLHANFKAGHARCRPVAFPCIPGAVMPPCQDQPTS